MKNLVLRSLSGIIYVALIVGALVGGLAWSTALFSIFCVVAMLEFQHITMGPAIKGIDVVTRTLDVVVGLILVNVVYILDFPEIIMTICIGMPSAIPCYGLHWPSMTKANTPWPIPHGLFYR